jgi:hypothetical protein
MRSVTMGVVQWLWIGWIVAGVGLEMYAIFDQAEGDTLSECVWSLFTIPGWGKFLTWMTCAFLLWLAAHFASRGKLG